MQKLMTASDIEMALLEVLSEDENEPDSSESDTEEEIIEERSHSSDSEQSAEEKTDLSDDEVSEISDFRFYIGKDGQTIWISEPLPTHKTKAKNIIKILPGPKMNAKNTPKELDAFYLFITEDMLDDIVTNTNIYILKTKGLK
ncbi:hypothetical protein C0J52_01014 [Blattella germanica]|nr:hypothetical protein C0J52_01014 [Blattella germanica]